MSKFCFHYIIWPSLFTTELRTDFINSSTCQQLDNVWFNGLSRLNFRYWLFLVCARLCPRAPRAWKLWHGQAGICQFYFYRATGKAGMAKIAGRRAIPGTGMPIAHHYWETWLNGTFDTILDPFPETENLGSGKTKEITTFCLSNKYLGFTI